jgi:GAF domain-containing protein/cache domain-containing protein
VTPPRRSLLARVVFLVLLPLVPLLAFVLYAGIDERRDAAREAKGTALKLAQAVSANQEQLIEEARQLLTTLAKEPRLRRGDLTACNIYLADTLSRWPRYANLGVIALDGSVACSALPHSGVNASDRLYFQEAVATRDFSVGEYQIGRITGKASLNFGYPLLDDTGQVEKIAFAALDLTWLNALAADANLNPGTTITVLDRKGKILARYPDSERWVGRSARREPLVLAVLNGEEGTAEERGLDGVDRYYGFTPLPRGSGANPVYVTAGIPTETALAAAGKELTRNLAAVALLAVFAGLMGWLGGWRFVVKPIERRVDDYRASAQKIAHFGEDLASGRESGELAATILTEIADAGSADVGAVYFSAGRDGSLSLETTRGFPASALPKRLAPGEGRAGRALVERRPIAASEEEGDTGLHLVALGQELSIRHELYLPVAANGDLLGVVALGRAGDSPFSQDEIELLSSLATQAGAALAAL